MKQNKIVAFGLVFLVLAAIGGFYYKSTHKEEIAEIVRTDSVKSVNSSSSSSSDFKTVSTVESGGLTLNRPEPPIGGDMFGVIEVGSSGFNAFAVLIDRESNWEVQKKIFDKSLAKEGMISESDIRSGLKAKASELSELGVAGRRIHFVVSSGALQEEKVRNIMTELKKSYTVQEVTADGEGKYGLRTIPKSYRESAFFVDMGSGNTKISWYEGSSLRTTSELPGAKYYADGTSDDAVYQKVKDAASKVPEKNRAICFIIGGIPFELSKEGLSTNLSPRFTELKHPEEYSAGDNAKRRSGLNIYRAIAETTGTKNFIFDADANFTIGYLLARN